MAIASSRLTCSGASDDSMRSLELIGKVSVLNRQAHTVQRCTSHRPCQELPADRWQHGIGQDRVDHAPATFDLRAARHNELDCVVIVLERDPVMRGYTLCDPSELEPHDVGEYRVAQRVIRDDDET